MTKDKFRDGVPETAGDSSSGGVPMTVPTKEAPQKKKKKKKGSKTTKKPKTTQTTGPPPQPPTGPPEDAPEEDPSELEDELEDEEEAQGEQEQANAELPAPAAAKTLAETKIPPPTEGPSPDSEDLVEPTEPVVLGSQKLPPKIVHMWDDLMIAVSTKTRDAVWEQGISSMEVLLKTRRWDLLAPRGKLTEAQIQEIEKWLETIGYKLSTDVTAPARPGRPVGRPPGVRVMDTKSVNNDAARLRRIEYMNSLPKGG